MDRTDSRTARLRGFLQTDPGNTELALALADELLRGGQPSEAREVLSSHPSVVEPVVQHRLAQIALAQGDYVDARERLQSLLAHAPASATIVHDLAFALIGLRRLDEAAECLDRHGFAHESDLAIALLRARLAMLQGRFGDAVGQLQALAGRSPDDAQVLGVLALALFDDGRESEARVPAQRAIALDAEQHEALLALGSLSLSRHDADEAGPLFILALRRHPGSGRALSGLGQSLLLRGELPNGEFALERATVAMPEHLGTWHALAWSQLLQGKRDDAEHSYQQAYELDRNFGESHGGLALVAALKGDAATAEAAIKRALRLDPQSPTAHYARIVLQQARGEEGIALDGLEALRAQMQVEGGIPTAQFAQVLSMLMARAPGAVQ